MLVSSALTRESVTVENFE